MSKYSTVQALKAYGKATKDVEDDTLQSALDWAEGTFERLTGSQFDRQTVTNEIPARAWIDRKGQAWLIAQTAAPVISVSAISYRLIGPGTSWTALSWTADDIFLPPAVDPPSPKAWMVSLLPSNYTNIYTYGQQAADNILFKWTYVGGYASTPDSLAMILHRLAWWKYQLRQAPLGQISTPPFGTTEIIPALPADIRMDIGLWTRKVLG